MEPADRLRAYRAAADRLRALEPNNAALHELRNPRLPSGTDLDRIESEVTRAQERRTGQRPTLRDRPEGMSDDAVYVRWKETLGRALRDGGITDAHVFLRGSGVTG